MHWFGVSTGVVWKWRRAFGVGGHATTKGSKRAIRAAAKQGGAAMKATVWTAAARRERSRRSTRLGLRPPKRPGGRVWAPAELAACSAPTTMKRLPRNSVAPGARSRRSGHC